MNFGPDYDRWLDAERERRDCEQDAYVAWCEDAGLDPDDDHFDDFITEAADRAEDAAIERYEAMMEDRMADYERYGDE